jgi:hypothetical protein
MVLKGTHGSKVAMLNIVYGSEYPQVFRPKIHRGIPRSLTTYRDVADWSTALTWSWASVEGPVTFSMIHDGPPFIKVLLS